MKVLYDASHDPPAPFVNIQISNLSDQVRSAPFPALLDTGSDITVVPAEWIDRLNLARAREIPIQGYDGQTKLIQAFDVILRMAEYRLVGLSVVALPMEHGILGRDVANLLRLLLDGPALTLEILPAADSSS